MGNFSTTNAWLLSRAGELTLDPGTVANRSKGFTAAISNRDHVTLLVVRDESSMRSYLVTKGTGSGTDAAENLAASVAATASVVDADEAFDLGCDFHGSMRFKRRSARKRDTQVGADMSVLSQALGRTMRPGSWVAMSLRNPSRSEDRWYERWLSHRMESSFAQHPSLQTGAVVMAVTAGGRSRDDVKRLIGQVSAAMPGFDMPTKAVIERGWSRTWVGGGFGAFVGAVSMTVQGQGGPYLLATGAVIFGVLAFIGYRGSRLDSTRANLRALRTAPKRQMPPRRPRQDSEDDSRGKRRKAAGDYPLDQRSFMVGAHQAVGLVAPHGGGVAGATGTASRAVPPVVAGRIGPVLGTGKGGTAVHLSAADSFAGLVLLGRAGSGKSVALHQLFAWHMLERKQPSGLPGAPGPRCATVVVEAKRDGAMKYMEWSDATGGGATLIDVMDASTYAIDLTPTGGTLIEKSRQLVNQMKYAFGEDAIAHRSFDTLVTLAMGALCVDGPIADEAGVERGRSVLYYMGVLVEAYGTDLQKGLAGAIISESVRRSADTGDLSATTADLVEASANLRGFFSRTDAQRRQFTDAPSSKIKPLLALGSWWEPTRPRLSWTDIITNHGVVVINVSSPVSDPSRLPMDEQLSQQLQAMLAYSLRTAIQSTCAGWQDQGRSVAVFCDELSLFAGTSPEVVTWLRDQGRSFGARPFFAAQYPEQLDPLVRTSVLGFSTLLAMTQDNPQVATSLAQDFAADGTEWSASDVVNLPRFNAIARMNVEQQRQAAFTFQLSSWEDNKAGYAAAQGYAPVIDQWGNNAEGLS